MRLELLHDIHGELHLVECIDMIKRIEPYRPYFIEDPFYPEEIGFMNSSARSNNGSNRPR